MMKSQLFPVVLAMLLSVTTGNPVVQPEDSTNSGSIQLNLQHLSGGSVGPRAEDRNVAETVDCSAFVDIQPGNAYIIESPNFPDNYSDYTRCTQYFLVPPNTEVIVECSTFDIACSRTPYSWTGDWFSFDVAGYRYYYCEQDLKNTIITGFPIYTDQYYFLETTLHSDYADTAQGFSCKVHTYEEGQSHEETTTTTTTTEASNINDNTSGCDCGRESSNRIVGGTVAEPNNYPWQVALVGGASDGAGSYCGGSIISSKYVLTAAHCVYGESSAFVRIGEHDLTVSSNTDGAETISGRVITHPGYNTRTLDNDFAIIVLDKTLNFNDKVRPVCMPFSDANFDGKTATVTGWGTTSYQGSASSVLREVDVTVMTNEDCNSSNNYQGSITNAMICAHATGKDSCQGDSGGPLVVGQVLAGVVSWGEGCATLPGVYARVTAEVEGFIKENAPGFCQRNV